MCVYVRFLLQGPGTVISVEFTRFMVICNENHQKTDQILCQPTQYMIHLKFFIYVFIYIYLCSSIDRLLKLKANQLSRLHIKYLF